MLYDIRCNKNVGLSITIAVILVMTVSSLLTITGGVWMNTKQQLHIAYAQQQMQPQIDGNKSKFITPVSTLASTAAANDTDSFTINLRIRGIDYSNKMAQAWITVNNNETSAYNINPIALLDPEDDGDGLIQIPVKFPHGTVKSGDQFTACIKILVDSDSFGDTGSCQKGIVTTSLSQPSAATTSTRSNQTGQAQTFNLFL
jgi:hypothetical protein